MEKLIKVSGNDVDKVYVSSFAKALVGQDIGALIGSFGAAAQSAPESGEKPAAQKKGGKDKKGKLFFLIIIKS